MNVELHFIIGIGRSGTSILSKLLNNYKDVHCMPEANFLVFFLQRYRYKTHFTPAEINAIFEEIDLYTLSHPLVGWQFNAAEARQAVMDLQTISYPDLCLAIYRNFKVNGMNKEQANLLIDKNPSYTIFVNKISAAFPGSKFIFIIRDYRANILSRKQSIYLKSPDIAYNATRWKLYNREAAAFYKKHPGKVLLIRYEDLVSDPNREMLNIREFLGIRNEVQEPSSDMKAIDIADYKIADQFRERFIKKYSDLNKVLNKDRLDVWKEKLSRNEIELADAICAATAEDFGYKPIRPLNTLRSAGLKIKSLIPILKGYADVYKDKLIYRAPIELKLKRLRERYAQLGFLKK